MGSGGFIQDSKSISNENEYANNLQFIDRSIDNDLEEEEKLYLSFLERYHLYNTYLALLINKFMNKLRSYFQWFSPNQSA